MLNDYKIQDWTNPIINEADRPQRSASSMKEVFDSNSNQLRAALNNLIDALAQSGAEDIGAAVDGMEGNTVETILTELKGLIDSAGEDIDAVKAAVLPEGAGTLFLRDDGTWALPSVGASANGVVAGGAIGDLYVKKSLAVYDGEWKSPATLGLLTSGDTVALAEDANMLGGQLPSAYQPAGNYAAPAILRTVTLGVAAWTGAEAPFTQTVTVNGATSVNAKVISPAYASVDEYAACGVKAAAEGAGTITFACAAAPENDLIVNVAILG